jgi:outer membrane protein assembly factor BamB
MTEKLVVNGNTLRNRKFTMLALVLMFTIALPFAALPASAQTPRQTYPYIGALPNPVGVGQETLFHVGATEPLSSTTAGYEGLSITLIDPDGHTTTIGDIKTDATGGTGRVFTPNIVGNWTVQTHFPEQQIGSTLWLAADSAELTLVVQEEPLEYYPNAPLPTEYWTRPIDNQLREWYVLAGSWLNIPDNLYAPYNDGPETAHILWTKPLTSGGMVGGELGLVGSGATSVGFENGDAYEGKWTGSSGAGSFLSTAIIVAGKLYYIHTVEWPTPVITHCVDLRTGEEQWAKVFLNNQTIDFAQLFYFESFNYQGTYAYLWVTIGGGFGGGSQTWHAFDAFTGDWMYSMESVPGGTSMYGPSGEICKYSVSTSAKTVTLWNSTYVVMNGLTGTNAGSWGDRVHGQTVDASRGNQYTWDIQYDGSLPGSVLKTFLGDRIIGGTLSQSGVTLWGIDMSPGHEGEMLFEPTTWDAPSYWEEGDISVSGFGGGWFAWGNELAGANVGVIWLKETMEHYGFSTDTGEYLWGPTEPQYYLDALDDTGSAARAIAYGRFYSASVSGIVYCYNATTGEKLWEYDVDDPYTEILWSNNWWQKPLFITDGKIYVGHNEHSANQPLPRGAPMVCLNATTGEVIFRANGLFRQTRWGGRAIIGDSVIATMDTYDQRVYAIGKGPSATTVSAKPEVSVEGSSVLLTGMVTDISPGTDDYKLTARFPHGVPAISDENMSEWMLHVYKQFAQPADVVGVDVTLTVLDPNGNVYQVATATSDVSGFYSATFVPEVPGKYLVYAAFDGSEAYFGSYAEAAINVDAAPQPTSMPTPTPAPMTDTYVLGLGAASIAAIVVIGLVLILMLRKR